MSDDDAVEYWEARHRRQGPTYVAGGGRADVWRKQLREVTPVFADALPDWGRVLDFGCGPGRFRHALERHGLEWTGVDIIPGLGNADAEDLEPESFDAAVAVYVLQHITDPGAYRAAVRSLHGWLRPGGRLLVIDHVDDGRPWQPHMKPRGPLSVMEAAPWSDFEVLSIMVDAPLVVDAAHWVGVFDR